MGLDIRSFYSCMRKVTTLIRRRGGSTSCIRSSLKHSKQATTGILRVLDNNGNKDDLIAFMSERMLPVEEIQAAEIADEILRKPPIVGYLTISNALQWRLQYSRVIEEAANVAGIHRLR